MTNMGLFTQGNDENNGPLMQNQNGIYGPGPHGHPSGPGYPPGQGPHPSGPGYPPSQGSHPYGQGPPPNNQSPSNRQNPNNGGQSPAANPFGALLMGGAGTQRGENPGENSTRG